MFATGSQIHSARSSEDRSTFVERSFFSIGLSGFEGRTPRKSSDSMRTIYGRVDMEAREASSAPSQRGRSPRVGGIVHGRTIPETKST